MKRFVSPILALAVLLSLVAGVVWKIMDADECLDRGGIVVGAMTRTQFCAEVRKDD